MDAIVVPVVILQTQPLTQGVWPSVPIMGTIEWPPIQRSLLIITPQPAIEIALACAYCQ